MTETDRIERVHYSNQYQLYLISRKIKFINWLALKFCPAFGKSSPSTRRKFGQSNYHHQHDVSAKAARSDFTTSLTDSLVTRSGKFSVKQGDSNGGAYIAGKGKVSFSIPIYAFYPSIYVSTLFCMCTLINE